jgi:hypothetical protein
MVFSRVYKAPSQSNWHSILTFFYPRSHTKDYEDTRRIRFVRIVVKDGAFRLDNHLEPKPTLFRSPAQAPGL